MPGGEYCPQHGVPLPVQLFAPFLLLRLARRGSRLPLGGSLRRPHHRTPALPCPRSTQKPRLRSHFLREKTQLIASNVTIFNIFFNGLQIQRIFCRKTATLIILTFCLFRLAPNSGKKLCHFGIFKRSRHKTSRNAVRRCTKTCRLQKYPVFHLCLSNFLDLLDRLISLWENRHSSCQQSSPSAEGPVAHYGMVGQTQQAEIVTYMEEIALFESSYIFVQPKYRLQLSHFRQHGVTLETVRIKRFRKKIIFLTTLFVLCRFSGILFASEKNMPPF